MGLFDKISKEQLNEGMRKAVWEGRMEEVLPDIFVDGAHNEDGIEAFLNTVAQDECKGRRLLLFSVVHDKRFEEMVAKLVKSGLFAMIGTAPLANGRAVALNELETIFEPYNNIETNFYETVEEAFDKMQQLKNENDRLYIVGSLYLVGQIKAYLNI